MSIRPYLGLSTTCLLMFANIQFLGISIWPRLFLLGTVHLEEENYELDKSVC